MIFQTFLFRLSCCLLLGSVGVASAGERTIQERLAAKDSDYWFFKPLTHPEVPVVKDRDGWCRNEIDRFILAKQEALGIVPAPRADARTLIRRAYFDLIGLPPEFEEVQAFREAYAKDPDAAFEHLIDELLKSPRYGERWGRHWLDLARYGDSNGYKADEYRPHMWRYRDWVIGALNADMPYDQFVRWQIAGDEVAPENPDAVTATGFLRLWPYESNQRDAPKQWGIILEDITDVSGSLFLGLSMGCAKCHDHKFDPILQDDYFRLQAFFSGIYPDDSIVAATPEEKKVHAESLARWEESTAALRKERDGLLAQGLKNAEVNAVKKFSPELQALYNKPEAELTPLEVQHKFLIQRQVDIEQEKVATKLKDAAKARYEAIEAELKKLAALKPKPLTPVYAVRDVGPVAPAAYIPDDDEKRSFSPGFLSILDPGQAKVSREGVKAGNSSGRRTALADWMTRPDNQITTRVMVNRLWHYHFGSGIVATGNDFGKQGTAPTHPELLDWLAQRFVQEGWSLKRMQKLIMTSAVWQQASLVEPGDAASRNDPGNQLIWRQRIRRLEAEQIRDATLQSGHELDFTMGGAGYDGEAVLRRSIYQKLMKNPRTLFLNTFDGPDGFNSCACRDVSTTAPQALVMLNNDFLNRRAQRIAGLALTEQTDDGSIDRAFQLVLGREPSGEEVSQAREFLDQVRAGLSKNKGPVALPPPTPKVQTTAFKEFPTSPYSGGSAVNIQPNSLFEKVEVTGLPRNEGGSFTVQAVLSLDSLYPDASVRTIASRWRSSPELSADSYGWSLGITSVKSKYSPGNLIVQLTGQDNAGNPHYEVIASGIHLPEQAAYYVAAVIETGGTDGGTVTFHARNLSDPDAKMESVIVPHPFTGPIQVPERRLFLGGRDEEGHLFDGSIARFALHDHALKAEELLTGTSPAAAALVDLTFQNDQLPPQVVRAAPGSGSSPSLKKSDPRLAALIDLSLALLNSNEFLYID